jgi:hypothetical protein
MDAEVAAAHERMVEQLMSDERLLGALPEEAAGRLLDWAVGRLTAAAETAGSAAAYEAMADTIRQEARRTADGVADEGGDLRTLERWLSRQMDTAAPGSAGVPARPRSRARRPEPRRASSKSAAPAEESTAAEATVPALTQPDTAPPAADSAPTPALGPTIEVEERQAEAPPTPTEPGPRSDATDAADDGRTAGPADELREALDDAVERLRSLFRRRGGEG